MSYLNEPHQADFWDDTPSAPATVDVTLPPATLTVFVAGKPAPQGSKKALHHKQSGKIITMERLARRQPSNQPARPQATREPRRDHWLPHHHQRGRTPVLMSRLDQLLARIDTTLTELVAELERAPYWDRPILAEHERQALVEAPPARRSWLVRWLARRAQP